MTATDLEFVEERESVIPKPKSKAAKPSKQEQLLEMGETMVDQGGLLNAAQAAIFLEISRERVYELMELGMLRKYEFLGRAYVSFKAVKERRVADVKAGRPKRGIMRKIITGLQATANMDMPQIHQGVLIPDKQFERDMQRRKKKLKK